MGGGKAVGMERPYLEDGALLFRAIQVAGEELVQEMEHVLGGGGFDDFLSHSMHSELLA